MKPIEHIPILKGSIFSIQLELEKDFLNFFKKIKYQKNEQYKRFPCEASKNLNLLKDYNKDLNELNLEIEKSIKHIIEKVYEFDSDFFITKSWATKTKKNGFSDSHTHSNSWLSGIYYPEYDPNFFVEFYNDVTSTFSTPARKGYNIYNSSRWKLSPKKDTFIIFPSELRHAICTNNSNKTRYSLALNILPKGIFGLHDSEVCFKF